MTPLILALALLPSLVATDGGDARTRVSKGLEDARATGPTVPVSELRQRAIRAADATTRPVAVVRVEPGAATRAEAAGATGRLTVECVVDELGAVRECVVVEPWPDLEPLALAALAQWRFDPATLDGRPQAVLLRWTWEHRHPPARSREWKRRWKFRWDRPALSYEW
jgi:TonB family protein